MAQSLCHDPGSLSQKISHILSFGNHVDKLYHGFGIAKLYFHPPGVIFFQDSFFKAFHGEGDGATAGNGVEAIIITKIPCHSNRFQVLNVTHRSKCSDGFIFRAFAFSTSVRAISDF